MDQSKRNETIALKKKVKTFKFISIFYASILVLMIIIAFVTTQRNGITFMTFLPLFFAPMEIINIFQYKKFKKQLVELEGENG